MTREFSISTWQNGGSDYFLNLTFAEQIDFKPMIQLYKYADPETKISAVLIEPSFIQFLEPTKTIFIKSATAFAGYVVVR